MAEHGGYRTPTNVAPVSGPGAHSARTDRGPKQMDVTGQPYGDAQALQQAQSASPLSPPSGAPGSTAAPAGLDLSGLVGLSAPSSMPDVPVTDGAAAGPGLGPEALGGPKVNPDAEEAKALGKWLSTMISVADSDGATPAFRRYVREVIRNI